jgi:hypothetical protein
MFGSLAISAEPLPSALSARTWSTGTDGFRPLYHAQLDAFVADVDGRTGDELAQLVLALAAEPILQKCISAENCL